MEDGEWFGKVDEFAFEEVMSYTKSWFALSILRHSSSER